MIVRTYGRRARTEEEEEDPYGFNEDQEERNVSFSLSQDNHINNNKNKNQDLFDFTFSSQDSTRCRRGESWDDTCPSSLQLLTPVEKVGKKKRGKREEEKGLAPTATLMETQEYGEMMECVDEVDFALDGLKKGHSLRVRRVSLLSLLTVCGDLMRRRLLKAQGIAKTIIDAILDINLDDSPSNLAAATLFYILTSDDQDRYLLDSSSSIRFLLQLLKPVVVTDVAVDKAPTISQKLLALGKELRSSHYTTKMPDLSSTELIHKVLDTLVTCKDLKENNAENDDLSRPELNANWVSLLTMEKACMSTISIEDTSGTMRKTGGNFKEKLRELGGLGAIFKLVVNLHSTVEGLVEHVKSIRESKEGSLQCLPLLLKCLKIMENATFLSKENQSHLLGLKQSLAGRGSSLSFVQLFLKFIDVLSDLTLLIISPASSSSAMPANHTNGGDHCAEFLSNAGWQVENNRILSSISQECSSSGRHSADSGFHPRSLQSNCGSTRSKTENHVIEIRSSSESGSPMMDMGPTIFGPCSLTPESSDSGATAYGLGSKTNLGLSKRPYDYDDDLIIDLEESQDPFAFDEDDCMESKWDLLPGKQRKRGQKRKSKTTIIESEDRCLSRQMLGQYECRSRPMLSQEELGVEEQNEGLPHSSDTSCTTVIDDEKSSLVADCLLTAIKVLMNLTNDNAVGCREIAACGGLGTLSSLIARHFPSFRFALLSEIRDRTQNSIPEVRNQTDVHLSDQDLDFLVTILGLLVNMVENNANNRSTLAATKVALPGTGGLNEVYIGVIPLLCCIFMANRGAGETAEEELQSWDEEEVVLQGEKEAEQMIVEAYSALLLAFLSTESKSVRDTIASHLPDRSLKVLVPVLERFVTFHLTLNMISPETHKTVSEVIESCRLP